MVKATWIVLAVLGAVALLVLGVVGSAVGAYNSLNSERNGIQAQSKQVDVQYQRAFELLPKILNITDSYMQNERDIQTQVAALRSGLTTAQNGNLTQKDNYSTQLNNLVLLVGNRAENYPDLKASGLVANLQDEVTNTYNKITSEKVRYNDRVQEYNTHRSTCCLPLLVANMFGFSAETYIGYTDSTLQTPKPTGQPI